MMVPVISVLFAVLTALSNGAASVLQRRAALNVPDGEAMHLSLTGHLLRQKVWLCGIGLVIVAAVCQAVALATGPIAVVQPIFVIELPVTLLLAGFVMRARVPRTVWYGVAAVTAGLLSAWPPPHRSAAATVCRAPTGSPPWSSPGCSRPC